MSVYIKHIYQRLSLVAEFKRKIGVVNQSYIRKIPISVYFNWKKLEYKNFFKGYELWAITAHYNPDVVILPGKKKDRRIIG
jgi:hypothetical protein